GEHDEHLKRRRAERRHRRVLRGPRREVLREVDVRRGAEDEGEALDDDEAERPPPHDVARTEHHIGERAQIDDALRLAVHRASVAGTRPGVTCCSGFVPRGQPQPANATALMTKPMTYAHGFHTAPM